MNKALTLMAVGDIKISRPSPAAVFDGVRPVLGQADLLFGNQEAPIGDRGQPLAGKLAMGGRNLRSVPGTAKAEAEVGFSAMALANNHVMDFGEEGLFQTMELLQQHGIAYAGAGRNREEAGRPAILERHGTKVAMLSYTSVFMPAVFVAGKDQPGLATVRVNTAYQAPDCVLYEPGFPAITVTIPDALDTEAMLEDVRRARQAADVVTVQFHWGVGRGYGRVIGYMKELGRAAIDAGADLILGHHPHMLLGFEPYKTGLICYSLGNFVFHLSAYPRWLETVIFKGTIRGGRFDRFSVIPAMINKETVRPEIAQGEEWNEVRKLLEDLSREFGAAFTPEGNELVLSGPLPGTPAPLRAPEVFADSLLQLPYPTSRGQGITGNVLSEGV